MTAVIEGSFFQQFCGQALAVLADSGIKGVVLLALAFLITLSLRRASAAARHLVWALALSALCLLPILSLVLPKWQLPILPRTALMVIPARVMIFPPPPIVPQEPRPEISLPTPAGPLETVGPSEKPVSTTTARQSPARPLPISFWLVAGWFMVALAALVPLLAGFVFVGRLVRQARRLEHDPWPSLLRSLSERLGLRRRVRVLRTNGATMPMSVGVWRPAILLPKEAEEWTEDKRRAVLLHELAHVKRRDCLTHVLSRLACAVHWFNPLAWAGFRKLQAERERACDDLVLGAGARAAAYADQLLEIARTMHAKAFTSAAAITMARRGQLEGRLLAILDAARNRRYPKPRNIFAGVCVALCLVVPLAMAQIGERKNPPNPADSHLGLPAKRTASPSEDNPLGLSDDVLKKLFETGQSMRQILTAVQAYRIDHQRAPEKMEDLLKPVDYLGKVPSDPFGPGPLRLIVDPAKAPDKVRVYSVGPDGKWDDGKAIDSSDPSLAGDLGAELDNKSGAVRFLADPTFTMHLEGKRLSHYLASKAEESVKPTPAAAPENVSRATTLTLAWGPEVDGLRAALELVPEQEAYPLGQVVEVRHHVRNVSRRAIQLASSDARQDAATFKDSNGKRIAGNHPMFTALGNIVRRTLQPGETTVFKGYGLGIGIAASEPKPGSALAGNILDGPPGKYTVTYSLRCPDVRRTSARDPKENVPQPEDWQGVLETGPREITAKPATPVVLELDNDRMQFIVHRISQEYGIRVCFEDVDYDMEKDVVRLGEFIQEMEAAARRRQPMSPAQKKRLEIARGYMKEGKSPDMPFDLKFFPYSGVYSATTIEGLLDKLTQKGPYTWKVVHRSYVVYPRERSVLDFPVSVDLRDVSLQDAVNNILAQSPGPGKISMVVVVTGPVRPRYLDARIRGNLRVQNSPAMYALTQAVESADSKTRWGIAGYKGQRSLGLSDVPDTKEPGGIAKTSEAPKPGDLDTVDLGGGVKMELVWVPAGSFQMGSTPSDQDWAISKGAKREWVEPEGPGHTVQLDGFWMGKFEVTQEQYEAVMGRNPSKFKGEKNPVEQVSWNDASQFCRKLTDQVGQASPPVSPSHAFRLPTEAEWEYACRAGSTTRYSFGDSDGDLGDYAWHLANSRMQTHPVGEKKANQWGLYDMHGNAWEWCWDWYADKYGAGAAKNPRGMAGGKLRVLRGGSWVNDLLVCRSAYRYKGDPDYRFDGGGFRVVCEGLHW